MSFTLLNSDPDSVLAEWDIESAVQSESKPSLHAYRYLFIFSRESRFLELPGERKTVLSNQEVQEIGCKFFREVLSKGNETCFKKLGVELQRSTIQGNKKILVERNQDFHETEGLGNQDNFYCIYACLLLNTFLTLPSTAEYLDPFLLKVPHLDITVDSQVLNYALCF